MTDHSLYERLGGVFSIAAVVDHFSDAIVTNPIVGQGSKNPALREWHTNSLDDCRVSSSCERCGSAPLQVGRSNTRRRSQVPRRSGWRRPIASSGSLPRSSMKSRLSSDARLTVLGCPSGKRGKFSQPLPLTRVR